MGNSIVAGLSAKSGPSAENGKLSANEQAELDQKMAAMDRSVQNRMSGKTEDGATYTSDGVRTYGTTAKVDSAGNVTDLSGNFHINAKELRDVVNNEQWDVLGSVLSLQRDDELAFGGDSILGYKKAGFLRSELNTYVDEAHVRIEKANALGNVSLTGITSSLTGALRAVSRGVSDNVVPAAREVLRDSALRTRTAVLENYHNVAPNHASKGAWDNFKTLGLTMEDAKLFAQTEQGLDFLTQLRKGHPDFSEQQLARKYFELINSGSDLPQKVNAQTLYKIIDGVEVGKKSAFFTTADEIAKFKQSGKTVADYFGLPAANENAVYNLFEMKAKTANSKVYRSTIAPAVDNILLNKAGQDVHMNIQRSGGGMQYLVPNRYEWEAPIGKGIFGG